MRSEQPVSAALGSRAAIGGVLAIAFTLLMVNFSRPYGRLLFLPVVDDVAYMNGALRLKVFYPAFPECACHSPPASCYTTGRMHPDSVALKTRLAAYNFYHCIQLNPEVTTKGCQEFLPLQAPVAEALERLPLQGKRVLDIGCRDGLFSLQAERLGASDVIGIDNDLSRGAVEVVLPYLKSTIQMYQLNLYDLMPETFGRFDIVIFPGVLYHLRYPMWGLKRIRDILNPQGWLLIETAVLLGYDDLPFLYCPIDDESPYEPTSV